MDGTQPLIRKYDPVLLGRSVHSEFIPRYSQIDFTLRCMFPKWSDWDLQYTRKGLLKRQARQALSVLLVASVVVGAYTLRSAVLKGSTSSGGTLHVLRSYLKSGLLGLWSQIHRAIDLLPD